MFIKKLLVRDFTLIAHNNIQSLEVDFKSKFQLVLGTNGSGKSSIVTKLLTGYPADGEFFGPKGYHELEMEHKGSTYTCIGDYSINKFKFIKDGEVINDNCTPTMMKGLVEQYFGIDKTLAGIVTDGLKFTTMNPQQRRQIIMKASGINIDVGMSVLDKFKERGDYYKKHGKNLSKRLVDEDNNLPSDSHVEELEQRRVDINHDLGVLDLMMTQPKDIGRESDIVNKIFDISSRAKRDALSFIDTPEALFEALDREGANEIIGRLRFQKEDLERQKTERYREIEELRSTLGQSSFANLDIDDLEKTKVDLEQQLKQLDEQSKGYIFKDEGVRQAVESAPTLYEELREIFLDLPDNSESYFTRDRRSINAERIIKIDNHIGILNREIHEYEHELKLHSSGDQVGCPACGTEFIPGVRFNEETLQVNLKEALSRMAKLEEELKIEKEYQVEITDYHSKLSTLEQLYRHNHIHSALINALKGYSYVTNNPRYCLTILEDWINDINVSMNYQNLANRLDKVNQDILLVRSEDLERRRLIEARLSELTKSYSSYIDQSSRIQQLISDAEFYIRYITNRDSWLSEAGVVIDEVELHNETNLNNMVHRFVQASKSELLSELASIEKQLTGINYAKLNRDRLLKEKEEVDQGVEDATTLYNELCPKTGMLGEAMDEFINEFVSKLNSVINAVWTYPIEVLPCRNEKGDLDFYFPVRINGRKKPNKDISMTSTAQSDIINFAFKLLIMKTHGLDDFPLFVDELAANMDDVHRVRIMKVIYDMIESEMNPQMFMISHYAAQHGTFTNAEVLVLNSDNLQTIPDGYNKHAKFN